jgi:hypothetical protein
MKCMGIIHKLPLRMLMSPQELTVISVILYQLRLPVRAQLTLNVINSLLSSRKTSFSLTGTSYRITIVMDQLSNSLHIGFKLKRN